MSASNGNNTSDQEVDLLHQSIRKIDILLAIEIPSFKMILLSLIPHSNFSVKHSKISIFLVNMTTPTTPFLLQQMTRIAYTTPGNNLLLSNHQEENWATSFSKTSFIHFGNLLNPPTLSIQGTTITLPTYKTTIKFCTWFIGSQYITFRNWEPKFSIADDTTNSSTIWICYSSSLLNITIWIFLGKQATGQESSLILIIALCLLVGADMRASVFLRRLGNLFLRKFYTYVFSMWLHCPFSPFMYLIKYFSILRPADEPT